MVRLTLLHSGVCVAQMGHNLYLVERDDIWRYDEYDFMVVCAANRRDARSWHPDGDLMEAHCHNVGRATWVAPEDVLSLQVTYLGAAAAGLQRGVVRASFNQG
jgi:hypothetical protein